ncbi:membrane protein [Streptomyces deserti]
MEKQADTRFQLRDGFGLAGGVAVVAAALAVLLLVTGLWKRLARETAPALLDLPGGSWAVGGALGLVTVFGAASGLWFLFEVSDRTSLQRALRATGTGICWLASFGPLFYLLGALPGKNCPSYESRCAYIPGTGSALLAFVISVALVGWLLFRRNTAAAEARAAQQRARMRKLRKKGKGKTRVARGR